MNARTSAPRRRPGPRTSATPPRERRAPVPDPGERSGRWGVAAPLLAAAVAFALFAPTLSFQFLNWDDERYVLQNPWIRSWSAENLVRLFTQPYFGNFLPLHLLSYTADYSLWKLNPFGYHLQSVLLHALNSALAWFVVRRTIGGFGVPLLASLFFAVHPAHVEAVAWISIRKDLLSTFFALLSVLFYLGSRRSRETGPSIRPAAYAASVISFGLALLSKVTVVTLPLFFLLLDRFPAREARAGRRRFDLATKVPFALVGLWMVWRNAQAQIGAGAVDTRDALSYAVLKGHAAWSYLGLLAGFIRGSPDYDLPQLVRAPSTIVASIAGLAVAPLAAWLAYKGRDRASLLGWGWLFITLLPALAFPLVTYMADRYLYLPSLGFCWILATWIVMTAGRIAKPRPRRAVLAVVASIPLILFIARTVENLPVWRDSESLWTYAMTRSRDFRPYANLAQIRIQQNRLQEAEQLLLVVGPVESPMVYQNLGVVYFRTGRYVEAAQASERALSVLRETAWDPALASGIYYNLAAAYAQLGETAKAVAALQASLREDPRNADALERLNGMRSK